MDKSGKDGEATLDGQTGVKGMFKDTRHFHFFARLTGVNQIIRQEHFLGPGHASRWDRTRRFLQVHSLDVTVDAKIGVEFEMGHFAVGARFGFGWFGISTHALYTKRTLNTLARNTQVVRHLKLGVDCRASRDDPADLDEAVQMRSTKVAQRIQNGHITDAHMNFGLNGTVGWKE